MSSSPPPSAPTALLSVVDNCGTYEAPCGYCGRPGDTSVCVGMWAHRLHPETYAALLDAGWRRSGCWLYRPVAAATCCVAHTIRLDARAFRASKAQRRAAARFGAYLAGGALPGGTHATPRTARGASPPFGAPFGGGAPPRGASPVGGSPLRAASPVDTPCATPRTTAAGPPGALGKRKDTPTGSSGGDRRAAAPPPRPPRRVASGLNMSSSSLNGGGGGVGVESDDAAAALDAAAAEAVAAGEVPRLATPPRAVVTPPSAAAARALPPDVLLCSSLPLAWAAAARQAGGQAAAAAAEIAAALAPRVETTLGAGWTVAATPAGYLNFGRAGRVRPVVRPPPSRAAVAAAAASALARRARLPPPAAAPPPRRPRALRVVTLPLPASADAIVAAEFPLYAAYQTRHHGEPAADVSVSAFRRFLVDTPLAPGAGPGAPPGGYGTFHQQYWIDDKLAAVGVVDVLPGGLSSVYCFWDPDLAPLSLGRVVALKEIAAVGGAPRAAPRSPPLPAAPPPDSPPPPPPPPPPPRHYYMGYYIASCPKMTYKAEYAPSELRCNVSGAWVAARGAALARAAREPRAPLVDGWHAPGPAATPDADRVAALNTLVYLQGATSRGGTPAGASPPSAPGSPPAAMAGTSPPGTCAAGRAPPLATARPAGGRLLRLGQLVSAAGADPGAVAALASRLAPWRAAVAPVADRLVVLL